MSHDLRSHKLRPQLVKGVEHVRDSIGTQQIDQTTCSAPLAATNELVAWDDELEHRSRQALRGIKALLAFNSLSTLGIPQFTMHIAVRYGLHCYSNQGIHRCKENIIQYSTIQSIR